MNCSSNAILLDDDELTFLYIASSAHKRAISLCPSSLSAPCLKFQSMPISNNEMLVMFSRRPSTCTAFTTTTMELNLPNEKNG